MLLNKTLEGKVIDADYYKGHVTIVSFMYIGCFPCMNEISILNKIKEDYSSNRQLQVLCVARQMRQQMVEFNSNNKTLFSRMRIALGADSIKYEIQPACNDGQSTMEKDSTANYISIKSECSTIEDNYYFTAYPTVFYVDKKGIVRSIHTGGPGSKNDPIFYDEVKKEIDLLLAE